MKSSRGFECWYVGLGGEIPQHMQVFCTGDAVKKKGGCSQLAFCVVLTLLQLSHQVVVLEESVTAECVCEQHLEESTTVIHQTCRMNPMESTEMFFVTNFFCLDESYMIEVRLAFKKKIRTGFESLVTLWSSGEKMSDLKKTQMTISGLEFILKGSLQSMCVLHEIQKVGHCMFADISARRYIGEEYCRRSRGLPIWNTKVDNTKHAPSFCNVSVCSALLWSLIQGTHWTVL